MKTTIIRKQYAKPSTQVFEMNARINLLTASDGEPDLFDGLGGDWQF